MSGIYDFLYREYSPNHGRWMSPDPEGVGAAVLANPQTWNRYGYVGNSPLSFIDPLGLDYGLCNDITYAESHAECRTYQGCVAYGTEGCIPFPVGYPGSGGGGGGGGGTGGGGTPPSSPPNTGGQPPLSGETLGLPRGLNLHPASLADLLGLSPGIQCDFGVCTPIGDSFVGVDDAAYISALIYLTGVTIYAVQKYGPGAIESLKHLIYFAGSAIDPYNQFLRDLKACTERYVPGPEQDKCIEQAKDKFRRATGRGPVN